jgi:V/A-type H+-transporting ATPase subunit B
LTETPPATGLVTREYRTLKEIQGPLIFVDRVHEIAYDEIVLIKEPGGETRMGRVLEVDGSLAMVQVFEGTDGLDLDRTSVQFTGDVVRVGVSLDMLGRILDGLGEPIDGGPDITPEESLNVNGSPINPAMREYPSQFIQTGISAMDGLNSLSRGQKLPIFSASGLPANQLGAQIVSQADVIGEGREGEDFVVVFAAVGITHREASFFVDQFQASGAMERTVVFLNHADDPSMERLITPRAALTTAEYLAFTHDRHVLVILTDITNYAEALREVSAAREEVPGRRGYPGYMYSNLATVFERAGRIRGRPGSITQLIVLSMPDDDITHPIPDLTGYITEGQIVLSRELHQKGIYPPIDILPSLSRLMDEAIGEGKTREDHGPVADQLYSLYAEGRDLRRMVAIIGEQALSDQERQILDFADAFERRFVGQGEANRDVQETLETAWKLLSSLPPGQLKRIPDEYREAYYPQGGGAS